MYKLKLEKFKIPTLGMSRNVEFNKFITKLNNKLVSLSLNEQKKLKYEIIYKKYNGFQYPIISTKNKKVFDIIKTIY